MKKFEIYGVDGLPIWSLLRLVFSLVKSTKWKGVKKRLKENIKFRLISSLLDDQGFE